MPLKSKPTVLLIEPIHRKYQTLLERRCRVIRPTGLSEAELADAAREADGILIRTRGCVSARAIAAAPRLKVIARAGVGLDHIDLEAARRAGVQVVSTPAGSRVAVAEHTWMLILALAKHALQGDRAARSGDYQMRSRFESLQLEGKTLGILGLGRIGTTVAAIARFGFAMKVLYTDLIQYRAKERRLRARKVSLGALLANSDILCVHVPLTRLTRGMIGARELARMRPGSFLINTARGAVVDARASAEALRAGRLAGAGVDVFDPEVPPPDHPLLKCPNAILSPHNAAQTPEARLNYASVVLDLLRVLDGKKPLFPASD